MVVLQVFTTDFTTSFRSLSNNGCGVDGAYALSLVLKNNLGPETLRYEMWVCNFSAQPFEIKLPSLDNNNFGDKGASYFADALSTNLFLLSL